MTPDGWSSVKGSAWGHCEFGTAEEEQEGSARPPAVPLQKQFYSLFSFLVLLEFCDEFNTRGVRGGLLFHITLQLPVRPPSAQVAPCTDHL